MYNYTELKQISREIDSYQFCLNQRKSLGYCPEMSYSASETTHQKESDQERIKQKIKEFVNRAKEIAAVIIVTMILGK